MRRCTLKGPVWRLSPCGHHCCLGLGNSSLLGAVLHVLGYLAIPVLPVAPFSLLDKTIYNIYVSPKYIQFDIAKFLWGGQNYPWLRPTSLGVRENKSCLSVSRSLLYLWVMVSQEGNGTPLQYSALENPMDRGAWWATVHGVAQSRTWLSNWARTHTNNTTRMETCGVEGHPPQSTPVDLRDLQPLTELLD